MTIIYIYITVWAEQTCSKYSTQWLTQKGEWQIRPVVSYGWRHLLCAARASLSWTNYQNSVSAGRGACHWRVLQRPLLARPWLPLSVRRLRRGGFAFWASDPHLQVICPVLFVYNMRGIAWWQRGKIKTEAPWSSHGASVFRLCSALQPFEHEPLLLQVWVRFRNRIIGTPWNRIIGTSGHQSPGKD